MAHDPRDKRVAGADAAVADIPDSARIMSGGFGLCGIPEKCIEALARLKPKRLTLISNNIGNQGKGLAQLLQQDQVSTAICSYIGGNPDLEARYLDGRVSVELVPQGTFAERIRAAGVGIRAFYTPTGAGTDVAIDKETRDFDRTCVLETALDADFALIKAEIGDTYGNLRFKETARNFSPLMAMAARVTIVEVETLVELGQLSPEDVHLPGLFVQRIFQGDGYENAVEHLRTSPGASPGEPSRKSS